MKKYLSWNETRFVYDISTVLMKNAQMQALVDKNGFLEPKKSQSSE